MVRDTRFAIDAGVADRIGFQRCNLDVDFPTGTFDLVSAQFFHTREVFPRSRVLRWAADTLTTGGCC